LEKRIYFFSFLVIFCLLGQVVWGDYFKTFKDVDKLLLGKDGSGLEIKITLKTSSFPKFYPPQDDKYPNFGFIGVGYFQPKYLITYLEIWRGEQKIGVPMSAYMDLVELHGIDLEVKTKNTFIVKLSGGDGGDGYDALLTVENGIVHKRVVRSTENPEYITQETNYLR
jgi:hypothetical protein